MTPQEATVLIVEDERDIADLFATWLAQEYTSRVAYDGEEALEKVDEDVEAVLLDRRMPGLSGDEVLQAFRSRGISCPVGMVTAVEPDLDILEMGFDDYIVKPVGADELLGFVESLLSVANYERDIRRLYQLASKKAALESTKQGPELETHDEYQALLAELEEVRETADANRDALGDEQLFGELP